PTPRGHETVVPNVRLLELGGERGFVPSPSLRAPREIVNASGADVAVIDLGGGCSPRVIDALLAADVAIAVSTPEPVAVEAVYRAVRHAYARSLARRLRSLGLDEAGRALRDVVKRHGGPPLPARLAEALAAAAPEAAQTAWRELGVARLRLVINESRSRADLDLGESMARVAQRPTGGALEYLGHVEFDDAVFLAARRRRPLLIDAPSAKAARNLERITRRMLSLEAGRVTGAAAHVGVNAEGPPPPSTHYEVLAIDRGASDEEIRRAYRRTREVYSTDSIALSGLLGAEEVARMVSRVEEARDVLLDPTRRRPYDLSITPVHELTRARVFADEAAVDAPAAPALPVPEITPETEFTGALLKQMREARGVELKDISARTRIPPHYLRAIEEEEFDALPAAVYTRGFVVEVAKSLRLDVEQVVRSYLRRYRKAVSP
ncbi:MAG: helix-turn-helix domain-containing protein, partial [Polyangiales bacterium]